MKNELNLIIHKDTESSVQRKLKVILPVLALVYALAVISVFFINLHYLALAVGQNRKLERDLAVLDKKVAEQSNKKATLNYLSTRLSSISKILEEPTLENLIDEMKKLNSSDVQLQSFSIQKDHKVTAVLTASSSAALAQLTDYLRNKETAEKKFKNIMAHGILMNADGRYSLSLDFHHTVL